jgi:hypothetical protein
MSFAQGRKTGLELYVTRVSNGKFSCVMAFLLCICTSVSLEDERLVRLKVNMVN